MASVTINPNGTSIEWVFQKLHTDQDSTTVQNNSGNTVYWWSSNEMGTKYTLNQGSPAHFDQSSTTLTYYFAPSQSGDAQISLTVTGSDDKPV